jgi:acetyl-CoA synthetase
VSLVRFDRRPFDELRGTFRWTIPDRYNIGVDVADKWADDSARVALIDATGQPDVRYTFAEIAGRSNRWANALAALGVGRGDRVAVILPQRVEVAIAHLAAYKLGAIAVPLAVLFGDDALEFRLRDSGASVAVVDEHAAPKLARIMDRLPDLRHVIAVDGAGRDAVPAAMLADDLAARASDAFTAAATGPRDPALIMYTSGTTGPPKGAVLPHSALIGHLPAFVLFNNLAPQPGDILWSPADWAWIGGLFNVLWAGWHYGIPVVAFRQQKFDPERAFWILDRYAIRNAFIFPTALKAMRQAPQAARHRPRLRSLYSAGEPVGEALIEWARGAFGVTINEFFGQTEMNLIAGNCAEIMPVKAGSIGKPYPGHVVEIVDEAGAPVPAGEVGEVALRRPDPVMFLGYWNNPEATEHKFIGDWALLGDLAVRDDDGYLWFKTRKDDLIKSGAYRIGPWEIEDCLSRHPAVAMAAVIGIPDPDRGQVVKAVVRLAPGHEGTPALAADLQELVKTRVGHHMYPRVVEFVDDLPMTTTGKLQRFVLRQRAASNR